MKTRQEIEQAVAMMLDALPHAMDGGHDHMVGARGPRGEPRGRCFPWDDDFWERLEEDWSSIPASPASLRARRGALSGGTDEALEDTLERIARGIAAGGRGRAGAVGDV